MRFLLGCMASAVLASLFTIWLVDSSRNRALIANDRGPKSESPVERLRPMTSRIFDIEGLTPDESVAVAVYEAVNRGVVNITAKAVKNERLLMKEHSEDTGSGA